jgi:hypothetical protein
MVEGDLLDASLDELLIQDIHHFQKRHVWNDAIDFVLFETAFGLRARLTPYFKSQSH